MGHFLPIASGGLGRGPRGPCTVRPLSCAGIIRLLFPVIAVCGDDSIILLAGCQEETPRIARDRRPPWRSVFLAPGGQRASCGGPPLLCLSLPFFNGTQGEFPGQLEQGVGHDLFRRNSPCRRAYLSVKLIYIFRDVQGYRFHKDLPPILTKTAYHITPENTIEYLPYFSLEFFIIILM